MARRVLAVVIALAVPQASAAFVLGGGFADTDCTIAFGGVDATAGASGVVCADGDPACDGDGTADGACRFSVSLCSHVAADACGTREVDVVRADGLPLETPPLDVDGACGAPADVNVAVGGAVGATTVARGGNELRDVDYLNLCCIGAARPLDAAQCAVIVDLSAAGCSRVPAGVTRPFLKARRLVARAVDGTASTRLLRQARRALGRARNAARRLAKRDVCGNPLGLVATHASDSLLPTE